MAFIPEDGTGLADANSYASVAEADAYFTDRNNTAWLALTDVEKQANLIVATEYLDNNYIWYSSKLVPTQALGWPRTPYTLDGILIEGVPKAIKQATYQIASSNSTESIEAPPNEGIKSEKYGDASMTYTDGASTKNFSQVKLSLRGYGVQQNNVSTIIRG